MSVDVVFVSRVGGPFTPEEDAVIRAHWSNRTSTEIGVMISRDSSSIRVRARRLGLGKKVGGGYRPSATARRAGNGLRPSPARKPTVVFAIDREAERARLAERKAAATRARWRVEDYQARRAAERESGAHTKCICGRPGKPFCDKHTAILAREGVL